MLQQQSPPIPEPQHGDVHNIPAQLPPLNNLPQWSRVNTLDRARYPKPFLKDRLVPLTTPVMDSNETTATAIGVTIGACLKGTDDGIEPSARLQHLERSLRFLQQQHQDVLTNLHSEIDALKRENKDLQFRVVMVQRGSPQTPNQPTASANTPQNSAKPMERTSLGSGKTATRAQCSAKNISKPSSSNKAKRSADSTAGHKSGKQASITSTDVKHDEVKLVNLEEEIKQLKKVLQEEKNKNEYLTNLIEEAQSRFLSSSINSEERGVPSEAQSAPPHIKPGAAAPHRQDPAANIRDTLPYNAHVDPLQVVDMCGLERPPTLDECEVVIKHLLRLNDRQGHELSQLKSDLRDVLYSHKWSPDAYLLAKAYVVEDDAKESTSHERLPRLHLKQQSRKLPEVAFTQRDQVMLPALKQTMGNKAIERRKRTQMLQKTRGQRREVLH